MKRGRINIDDADDLLCIMTDIVDEWMEDFTERDGYTRPVDMEDIESGWDMNPETSFIYTDMAIHMMDRYIQRLKVVFEKHFPDDEFLLSPSNYYEP